MTSKSIQDRLAKTFSGASTSTLVEVVRTLESGPRNPETNWARTQTIEELERRFPAASDAVVEAFDRAADDEHVDYVAVLLAAIERTRGDE
jgi:hypothetical protein